MRSSWEILQKLSRIERQYIHSLRNQSDPASIQYYTGWHHALEWVSKRGDQVIVDGVVGTGRCSGCAACVTVCPTNVFDYVEDHPVNTRLNHCIECDLCVEACPELHLSDEEIGFKSLDSYAVNDDGFGRYGEVFLSRSTNNEILRRSQDGGTVSSLLIYALKENVIDAAALSTTTPEQPLKPMPKLVFEPDDVLSCAGSRYTYAPNLLALKEAFEKGVDKLGVVGVPCQINGLRYLQHSVPDIRYAEWFKQHVVFSIGLFCSEVFTYSGLMKYFNEIGVNPEDVVKINIKGKVIISLKNGDEIVKPLKPLHKYERPACRFCKDYAADNADISVGGLATHGWTITVLRTRVGKTLFEDAVSKGYLEIKELSLEDNSIKLLKKLCQQKKERISPLFFGENL